MLGAIPRFEDVDPRTLYVNSQRPYADPLRLHTQIARFGASAAGMPAIWVMEDPDGKLRIQNGTTRAVRIAKLAPGATVPVVVIDQLKRPLRYLVKVADIL